MNVCGYVVRKKSAPIKERKEEGKRCKESAAQRLSGRTRLCGVRPAVVFDDVQNNEI